MTFNIKTPQVQRKISPYSSPLAIKASAASMQSVTPAVYVCV